MSTAAGTRRSLLHDVLSHSEVVELGLDGSIDDLPPLTTRFIPSCARVVNVFCWCYFLVFWSAVVFLARHVASADPHTLLPGPADFVFVAACTALLVGAELCVYCYVKKKNALPDSRGPMGDNFTPSTACILAHCSLSATTRMCTFLELLFLLHARVLPTPMLACATFTVCLTRGLVPLLLQLRSLTGYLCGDAFDPLHCSTCIPFASFESCIINCGRGSLKALSKGAGLVSGAALGVRRGFKRLADLCTMRFVRRNVSVAPSRRMDASCWLQGNNTSMARLAEACEAGLPAGDSSQEAEERGFASLKGPLVRLGLGGTGTGEPACGGSEGEAVQAPLASSHAVSTEASLREGWADHAVETRSGETPRDAVHGQDAEAPLNDNNFMRTFSLSPSRTVRDAARAGRGSPVFVSPRLALELTNCLLFLDLPTLTLHLKTAFVQRRLLHAAVSDIWVVHFRHQCALRCVGGSAAAETQVRVLCHSPRAHRRSVWFVGCGVKARRRVPTVLAQLARHACCAAGRSFLECFSFTSNKARLARCNGALVHLAGLAFAAQSVVLLVVAVIVGYEISRRTTRTLTYSLE